MASQFDNDDNSSPPSKRKIIWGSALGIGLAVSAILGDVYKDEGGYVNNKSDRGGETNYGVTKKVAVANGYAGAMKAFPKQCDSEKDVCADKIYYQNYIDKPGFIPLIQIDPAVSEELVNTAVNMGPYKPSKWLQQSLNETCPKLDGLKPLTADGKVGPGTVTYFAQCRQYVGSLSFCMTMLSKLDDKQLAEYDRIVAADRTQKVFYKGWVANRIGNVDRKKCQSNGPA